MANHLKMALIETIQSLHQRGWSQRRIAVELNLNRETVARHLRLAGQSKPAIAPLGSPHLSTDSKPAIAPTGFKHGSLKSKPAIAPPGSDEENKP